MAHVDKEQLYPFWWALGQHVTGSEKIDGVQLDDELTKTAERLPKHKFSLAPAPEHKLDNKTLVSMAKHAIKCKPCRLIVLEDGPGAERQLGQEELAELARQKLDEESRLSKRFFFSLIYGIGFFIAAFWVRHLIRQAADKPVSETTIGTAQELPFNPLWFVFFIVIFIAAWGLADAWMIANRLWLDWTRAQKAIPVIGDKWAARTKRKRKERGWD